MNQSGTTLSDYETSCKNFSLDIPEYFNFGFDVIDKWAKKDRNKLAMIWVNQMGEEKKFSFLDMSNLSNQAANILLKYGINKGDRVLVLLPRIPEWWIFTLALIKLGAVFAPCPTMLTARDIAYRVNKGKFRMIITDLENTSKVEEICDQCPSLTCRMVVDAELEGWASWPYELLYPAPVSHRAASIPDNLRTRSTDPMLIYFTSGTTGEPKMVLHDHSYPLGHIVTARFWQDLCHNDLHFTVSDTGWAKCAWGKIFGQWIEGACIFVYHFTGKFQATEVLPLLEKYQITTFCCPPTIYRMLILADLGRFDLSSLRHCCSAGEPLNPEVIRVWKEGTGITICEGYGQTETVCCVATFGNLERRPGSMGKPSPGWNIQVHDDEGQSVPLGSEGRLAISCNPRPPGLFIEYLDNPEENGKAFVNGWYYTGDKVFQDAGGYFWFVGRDDDVIKSSGYRIGPFEVESALIEHPSVREAAVVGSPDRIRGMIVKAFVVLNAGYEPSESLSRELKKYVKRTTAPYKYPREIEFVHDLPKTISGKIKRSDLRAAELKKYVSNE
jgi:acetyl-CoA synthetase